MLFRSEKASAKILGAIFIAAVAGCIALAVIYSWRGSGAFIYYLTMRPAWVWLAALLPVLAIGSAGVKGRWKLIGFAVWVIAFGYSEELFPIVRAMKGTPPLRVDGAVSAQEDPRIRIVTWNMSATPETIDAALAQISDWDADIVCLQECSAGETLGLALSKLTYFTQYNVLRSGDYAVLSRYRAFMVNDSRISETEGMVCSVELVPGVAATCANLHYPPPALTTQLWPSGGWAAVRSAEAAARTRLAYLANAIADYSSSGPVIVAGDFNMPGNYAGLKAATRLLTDSFLVAGRGWGKTVPAAVPMSRIDMIYLSRELRPLHCSAPGTFYGDHRPVAVEARYLGVGQ